MVLDMGVLGVWIGMFVDWYARAAAYLARYLSGRRKSIEWFKYLKMEINFVYPTVTIIKVWPNFYNCRAKYSDES